MALAFTVRSLDSLPGPLREHYARQPDGTYSLQTTGDHPTVAALQAQITTMRTVAQQEAHAANVRIAIAGADKKAIARKEAHTRAVMLLAAEVNHAGGNAGAMEFVNRGIYDSRVQIDANGAMVVLDRAGQPSPMTLRDLAAEFKADAPLMFKS